MFNHNVRTLNNIKDKFSIKDLENLSGIKAHTIRIWEKRYKILQPDRTESNIRYYNTKNLQRLLNVTLLYNRGLKISKIGGLTDLEILKLIREEISKGEVREDFVNGLKLAMLNFDSGLFNATYNKMLAEMSFRQIFIEVFVPLLNSVGLYWQSESITPAHEHFISNLVKQKLHINIERVQQLQFTDDNVYVLFLPINEIHELGLMYIHYDLILKEKHSIYLGQSVPIENLKSLQKIYKQINFISYFTVQPDRNAVLDYLKNINDRYLKEREDSLWVLGRNTEGIVLEKSWNRIKTFANLVDLLQNIQ